MLQPATSIEETNFAKGALLLVDKPASWTSFDAVHKIKNLIRRKTGLKKIKVGHSGTLDPMATGLLLICTGNWTKELHHLQGVDKKYVGEITLGIETDTYDAEGEVVMSLPVPQRTKEELEQIMLPFIGEYDQVPPIYSAIKKDGKALYALARAGKEVIPEPRRVVVHSITVHDIVDNKIHIEVHCGSGFYVRSLAHDIGAALGCGAHLSALRRTAVGTYRVEDAWGMEELTKSFS